MSNWNRDAILNFLSQYAPGASISQALSLADDFERNSRELFELQEAVAVLSETIIGLDKNGTTPIDSISERVAIQWALKKVQYCHGWVTIGPTSDTMNKLMEKIEHEIQTGSKKL